MVLLGAVADDYTGGSDMAGMLARQGVRTLQAFGLPDADTIVAAGKFDAVVVSLKTRSVAPDFAVERSLAACQVLRGIGARQVQFKYCSTFDSTDQGNIGPVADALMTALNTDHTVAVPALPVNGRTQYMGYLFVNGVLLSESPMRHHPLNPMAESNLVRHLQKQTTRKVGLLPLPQVRSGQRSARIGEAAIVLVDAIHPSDLDAIAQWCAELPLITGGSGITHALPRVWRERGQWTPHESDFWKGSAAAGKTLLIAGSCSAMTLSQIDAWSGAKEPVRVESLGAGEADRLADVCTAAWKREGAVLIYSSAAPEARVPAASHAIESTFAQLAQRLRSHYHRLVIAGGETSGAVVEALGIRAVEIGPEIDPGVPALSELSRDGLRLALKSGNFGATDFFAKATQRLTSPS